MNKPAPPPPPGVYMDFVYWAPTQSRTAEEVAYFYQRLYDMWVTSDLYINDRKVELDEIKEKAGEWCEKRWLVHAYDSKGNRTQY